MVNDNLLKMAQFIAKLRKEKKLTQKQLAKYLGVTDKAVSKWERGLSCPDISLLSKLSYTLGVTTSELLSGEKEKQTGMLADVRVESQLNYAVSRKRSLIARNSFWRFAATAFAISLFCILILIGCNLVIDRGLMLTVIPASILLSIWFVAILGLFIAKKIRIGSLLVSGFFVYITTLYYSTLNNSTIRDISTFNGFPKDYIPHYTIILVIFLASIALIVISFLIQKKKISSSLIFFPTAASITVILISVITVSAIIDYVDINFLGVDERFTILLLLIILINIVSLFLLAISFKRHVKQPKRA